MNNWAETFREEFRTIKEYENILIGGHSEIKCVLITGKMDSKKLDDLVNYIMSKNPPYKLKIELL